MKLGEVLRKWRLMSELNVRDAAKLIGISSATLCRVEQGKPLEGSTLVLILKWLFNQE